MPSTYRCAVGVPEMPIKEVRLSKEIVSLNIMPCCGLCGLRSSEQDPHAALDVSRHDCGCRQDSWKRDTSLKTICNHYNRSMRYTCVRGKWRNGQRERKFNTFYHLSRVLLDTCVRITRWIVDNDESSTVIAALTIALSFRSVVALSLSLLF